MSAKGKDRYEVFEVIGRGGMAEVYRGYDNLSMSEVALKVLHRHLLDDDAVREAFEREAALMQKFNHPAIARIYGMTEVEGRPAMVMDHFSGGDLRNRVLREGKLSESEVLSIAEPLLEALEYLHNQGVVHRDIKPHNVLIADDGSPVLIDLGIVQNQEAVEAGADAQLGTVEYMAPECVDGLAIDGRSDLYSMSVMLFELLCGHVPFRADSAPAVMRMHRQAERPDPSLFEPSLSAHLSAVIKHGLAIHPEERFQRAREMHLALRSGLRNTRSIRDHARWQRLTDEFAGQSMIAANDHDEEWVVFVSLDNRMTHGLAPFQLRGMQQIVAAYPEYQVKPKSRHAENKKQNAGPPSQKSSSKIGEALTITSLFPNRCIARGLSKSGALEIASHLESHQVPVRITKRNPGLARFLSKIRRALVPFALMWIILFVLFFVPVTNPWISTAMGIAMGATIILSSLVLGAMTNGEKSNQWWYTHGSEGFALDFRRRHRDLEGALLDLEEIELHRRIGSPRIQRSFARIMNASLHLHDALATRNINASGEVRELISRGRQLAESIIETEAEVGALRPAILVSRIEELDRRISLATEIHQTEVLMNQKNELRLQLERRDAAQLRLQHQAQQLLDAANNIEELLHRAWNKDSIAEEDFTVLDFSELSPERDYAPSSPVEAAVLER